MLALASNNVCDLTVDAKTASMPLSRNLALSFHTCFCQKCCFLLRVMAKAELIVLVDIYSKSDQEDIEVDVIRQTIKGFGTTLETTEN